MSPMKSRARARTCAFAFLPVFLGLGPLLAQPAAHAVSPAQAQDLQRAVRLAESGHPHEAMEIDQRLLQANPRSAAALKLKGMLLEDAGQDAQAAAAYEQAFQLAPHDPDLLLKTGIYQLVAGHPSEAAARLAQYSRLQPRDGDAWFYLGQAYHLSGQDKLALTAMRAGVKLEPDNPVVMQKYGELLSSTGDYQNGLQWLLKAQAANPNLTGLDYDIGNADYNLMDLPNAELNLTRAVASHSGDASSLEMLGETQIKLSKWSEANETYAHLLALRPNDPDALMGLGQSEIGLKNDAAAVDALTRVLAIDPTRFRAHFYLARAYAAQGKTQEAQHQARLHQLMMQQMSFVESAVREQREDALRDQARALLRKHDEQAAMHLYREHFQDSAVTAGAPYVFIGKTYLFMGQTDDALRSFRRALQIEPKVHGAHTDEGILALKMGDLAGAEAQFRAELANDPSYQMAIAEMGEVRYHQQNWSEASRWLTQSKTMSPELLYMLCDADFHLGQTEDADLYAEAAAAYGRNDAEFMRGLLELLHRNQQDALAAQLAASVKQ